MIFMLQWFFRSIYLSGGATQLPGFVERLHNELSKLVPPSIVIQVNHLINVYKHDGVNKIKASEITIIQRYFETIISKMQVILLMLHDLSVELQIDNLILLRSVTIFNPGGIHWFVQLHLSM